jgi:Na+/phosphate symporter
MLSPIELSHQHSKDNFNFKEYINILVDSQNSALSLKAQKTFVKVCDKMEQMMQQVIEQGVLNMAKQLEDQLDSQIHKLENLQVRRTGVACQGDAEILAASSGPTSGSLMEI